jgi:hypothetical protein
MRKKVREAFATAARSFDTSPAGASSGDLMHIFGPREAIFPSIQKDHAQLLGVNASTLEIDTVRKQLSLR